MNYRHIYHAGNFADVMKHVVVARIIDYLKEKEKAFRVIDTHAGIGLYDISSTQAQKTGEWRTGIARIFGTELPAGPAALLADYLGIVAGYNPGGVIRTYPGSPLIARRLLRRQDRLSAIEKHPEDASTLKTLMTGDQQVKVLELDGWLALGAHLPPKERRGLVLIDPPFEEEGEFARMAAALLRAHRRWPGGIYALWYPIKDNDAVANFRTMLRRSGIIRILEAALTVAPEAGDERLRGCGMVVVNPPYPLESELAVILPMLARCLGEDESGRWSLEWLVREAAAT